MELLWEYYVLASIEGKNVPLSQILDLSFFVYIAGIWPCEKMITNESDSFCRYAAISKGFLRLCVFLQINNTFIKQGCIK